MFSFVIALIAGLGFFLAARGAASGIGRSLVLQRFSMVIAAGILLGVAFADLIPEALAMTSTTRFAFGVAGGFLLLYMVESLSGGHTHHHEPHEHGHGHAHGHGSSVADEPCVPTHALLPFLLGLGFHNFADGLIVGIGGTSSDTAASAVAFGILVHQLPVGLSFAAVLHADGRDGRALVRSALLVAAMIPLGTLAIIALPDPSQSTLGMLLAIAAGALLYVSTGHLLPEAHSEDRRPSTVLAFMAALLVTVGAIGSIEHGHPDDAPHGAHDAHAEDADEDDPH